MFKHVNKRSQASQWNNLTVSQKSEKFRQEAKQKMISRDFIRVISELIGKNAVVKISLYKSQ